MPDWLLKIGLGGVQEFIAHSRKTRDLAAGSGIIRERVLEAYALATARPGVTPVVPHNLLASCCPPHQLVFHVTDCAAEAMRAWTESLLSGVRESWSNWGYEQFSAWHASEPAAHELRFAPELFKNQFETALECYWVAVSIGPKELRGAFAQILRLFDDRRHTRTFSALVAPAARDFPNPFTCSLCGVRAAVLLPPQGGWAAERVFVTRSEKLCAVCIARRWWALTPQIEVPSTHQLAKHRFFEASSFAAVRAHAQHETWKAVLDNLPELEQLADVAAGGSGAQPASSGSATCEWDSLRPLLPAFLALRQNARAFQEVQALPSYYALVVLDGDEMGKWFSADPEKVHFAAVESDDSFTAYQELLSNAVQEFAREVQTGLGATGCYVVYTGGDDALVLCPVSALLPLLRTLHSKWEAVPTAIAHYCRPGQRPTLTLHASVAHAKTPLQPVVHEAQRQLAAAKDEGGRNCFSVLIAPGSGASAQLLAGWDELEPLVQTLERLSNWSSDSPMIPSAATRLSMRLPHTILDSLSGFFEPVNRRGDPERLWDEEIFDRELLRVIRRSVPDDCPEDDWKPTWAWLRSRASTVPAPGEAVLSPNRRGCTAVAGALQVAAFLARVLSAEPNPVEQEGAAL